MNRSVETLIRFVNLSSAGLLAGSLGFGESALTPGWEKERPRDDDYMHEEEKRMGVFNSIAPVALASAITLAVGARRRGTGRAALDAITAVGLAGVIGTTFLGTIPLNRKLDTAAPIDYPSDDTLSRTRNWQRVHAIRTGLSITAFLCGVASAVGSMKERSKR